MPGLWPQREAGREKEEMQEGHTAAQPPTPQSSSTSSLGCACTAFAQICAPRVIPGD